MPAMLLALVFGPVPVQTVDATIASDTFLDRKNPTANAGRGPLLLGGIDKVVLVRFPELGVTMGQGRHVKSASLEFTLAGPGTPRLGSVGRVLRPWAEGGGRIDPQAPTVPVAPEGSSTWKAAISGAGGLDWERDGASGRNDNQPIDGATLQINEGKVTISGLQDAVQQMVDEPEGNFGFRIEFESTVQFFSGDALSANPRLHVEFEDGTTSPAPDLRVLSCQPTGAGPFKPGQKVSWRVNVRNYGDLDSQSQTLTVDQAGRQVVSQKRSGTIAVGGTEVMTFEAPWPDTPLNPSLALMSLRVATAEQDRNPSDNGLAVYPDGLPVYVHGAEPSQVQKAVTDLNQRVFPTSKFGAWPDGCVERLRVVTSPEGAIDVPAEDGDVEQDLLRAIVGLPAVLLRPYADKPPTLAAVTVPAFVSKAGQVGLLPDTRDDVLVPQGLAIPDSAATSLAFGDIPMVEHRMLSRSETTILNTLVGKTGADRQLPWQMTPNAIFFRVITPDGKPPRGARLDVYQLVGGAFGGVPVFSSALPPDGTVLMPPRAGGAFGKSNPYGDLQTDGSNGWLLAVVSAHDTNASSWIPVWQLWDEAARGNDAAGYVELRMQLSSGELDRTQNIALNKIVTDEAKRFPAQLNALVDGKVQTSLTFENEPEGYWIEVDMGRDLPIGEVSLTFDGMPWKQFRIVTYKTAQNPEDGQVWAEEANGPANTTLDKTDDGHTILRYLSTSVRSRFLRIVPLSPEAVKLSEITVVPLKTD